jgi:hypothetical protein
MYIQDTHPTTLGKSPHLFLCWSAIDDDELLFVVAIIFWIVPKELMFLFFSLLFVGLFSVLSSSTLRPKSYAKSTNVGGHEAL